jgi:16S rRNA (uracil1498-N3)-methyltransferase
MSAEEKRPRFFVPSGPPTGDGPGAASGAPGSFGQGEIVALPATEAHHAANVLRLAAGDPVELLDGAGGSALARIVRVRHGEVTAEVETARPPMARPLPVIELAFAVPKGNRLDWLLEKATELGTGVLQPVLFERSVAGGDELSEAKRRRWLGHCIAAAKQSGTYFLPSIQEPEPLADLLIRTRGTLGIYGNANPLTPPIGDVLRRATDAGPAPGALTIVVGPEGGLTPEEIAALDAAGFLAVRLGRTVLRIETAALALVATVMSFSK